MRICHKIGENGTKQMQIVNSDGNPLPIPRIPLSNKIIGFRSISIAYIDQNVIAFLHRFHRFFAICATNLIIRTVNIRILDFLMLNIWPMLSNSMRAMYLNSIAFRRMRQLAPSLLNDCPSLRYVSFDDAIFPAFPPNESANASDGQAVTKWLFTPCPNGLPKELKCSVNSTEEQWLSTMEQLKAAFSNASSPVTFCICFHFPPSSPLEFVVPFDLINEVTGEKLYLLQSENDFWLSRCPIAWDGRKWENVRKEMIVRSSNESN